jgi:ClpP class serine protease
MLNDGENMQAISAGKYKLMGAYWKALTDEEKGILQAKIDKIYSNFKTAMNSVRQCSEENMGNGLIFDGEEAAARGLTDGVVESLDELLDDLLGESD